MAQGTLNPASDPCRSSQAKYLHCFICCPGLCPHLVKDCPYSTDGPPCQLSLRQWPPDSLGATRLMPNYSRDWGASYLRFHYIKYLLLCDNATMRLHSKNMFFTVFSNMVFTTNSTSFINYKVQINYSHKLKKAFFQHCNEH